MLPLLLVLTSTLACTRRAPLPEIPVTTRSTPEVAGLHAELLTEGPLEQRLAPPDDADLVLLYGAEEEGSLDSCGCQHRPRGGVARQAAWRDAVQARDPDLPVLTLNAGGWLSGEAELDGSTRPDVPQRNAWMVRGLAMLAPTALNVGTNELRGLAELPGDPPELPLVSAHLHAGPPIDVDVADRLLIDTGELTVGITGIAASGPAWMAPKGWTVEDPERAARRVLTEMQDQADIVVLMADELPDVARKLAEDGLVDVVIDAWHHRSFTEPFRVGDAVWVRAHHGTMRVGELRAVITDGRIDRAVERNIDLDEAMPERPDIATVAEQARQELRRLERLTFGSRRR